MCLTQTRKASHHVQKSWKVCPSAQHLCRSSQLLSAISGRKSQLLSLWHPRSTQQPPQLTSELYKKLAKRFVYEELKIKSDFKIVQPPVTAWRVTFFFHLSLLPSGTSALPRSFPKANCKPGRKPHREKRGAAHPRRAEGAGSHMDAQHFTEDLPFVQEQRCSRVHSYLQQLGTLDNAVFHENFRKWLQAPLCSQTKTHTFSISWHAALSVPSFTFPSPWAYTGGKYKISASQTSSLNQHPVKLWVKCRSTSLPNRKGCNKCGF